MLQFHCQSDYDGTARARRMIDDLHHWSALERILKRGRFIIPEKGGAGGEMYYPHLVTVDAGDLRKQLPEENSQTPNPVEANLT